MRFELTREGLLVRLTNHNTTRRAPKPRAWHIGNCRNKNDPFTVFFLCVDSYKWTHQCWPTDKNFIFSIHVDFYDNSVESTLHSTFFLFTMHLFYEPLSLSLSLSLSHSSFFFSFISSSFISSFLPSFFLFPSLLRLFLLFIHSFSFFHSFFLFLHLFLLFIHSYSFFLSFFLSFFSSFISSFSLLFSFHFSFMFSFFLSFFLSFSIRFYIFNHQCKRIVLLSL